MAGAAQALQRASAEAAGAILDPASVAGRPTVADDAAPGVAPAPRGFRTPFREDDGVLYLIDQRRLPDALVEYACRSAGEVAFAIREMVIRGAPAIGQAAAIGLAMTAEKMRDSRPYARRATLRGSANALINARPTAVNLRWAVDRLMARYEEIGDLSEDGDAIADALRAEADTHRVRGHHRPRPDGRLRPGGPADPGRPAGPDPHPLQHRPAGRGPVRDRAGVVQAAHHADRPVHVWVDETRPYLQGARLTAWELAQAGVAHTLIPDDAPPAT